MTNHTVNYANFGQRLAAMLIDNLVFGLLLTPIVLMFFDQPNYTDAEIEHILQTQGPLGLLDFSQLLFQQCIILSLTVFLWIKYAGTPGKRIMNISVVDARTLQPLSLSQSITRYLGYFLSAFPLCMGFFWMLMDDKNQTWHDKLGRSIVIKGKANPKTQNQDSVIEHHNSETFRA